MKSRSIAPIVGFAAGLAILVVPSTARAREPDPAEQRRVALLVEETPLSYQSASWSGIGSQTSYGWGQTLPTIGADVRLVAGLRAGLAVSYVITRTDSDRNVTGVPGSVHTTSTDSGFAATPRIGYRLDLGSQTALVSRAGLRFAHSTLRSSTTIATGGSAPSTIDFTSDATWGVLGVLLELEAAAPVFVVVGPELSVRLGGSSEQSAPNVPPIASSPHTEIRELGLVVGVGARF